MLTLSYDLHVHPGPSAAPRWGDGAQVWAAAREAGVRGFVWKSHEQHTAALCNHLPRHSVRALGSASLNPWATLPDVVSALDAGALWLWGPTQTADGRIGWDLQLPAYWPQLAKTVAKTERPLVLATGHLDAAGRSTFAELAQRHDHLLCSITHSLFSPINELLRLAELGSAFEIDAYTYAVGVPGKNCGELETWVGTLAAAGATVYFTSDGGQRDTGNPFMFSGNVLERIADEIGRDATVALGLTNPAAIIAWIDRA